MKTRDVEQQRLQGQPAQREEHLSTADVARSFETDSRREATAERGRGGESVEPLFPADVTNTLRARWIEVQTGFVDQPREAVERADELVADAIKRLAESFSEERGRLESQWARGGNVSTEDLRVALQRYRSFFQRLLSL
jgi:hypothetical protein